MRTTVTRRLLASALAGTALAVALAAGPAAAKDKTYALVQINQQALFFNQMNDGAEKAAEETGVKLVIFNANNDPAAQNSAIETYIQQKVSTASSSSPSTSTASCRPSSRPPTPASRSSPSTRSCPTARTSPRSASTTRRPAPTSASTSSTTSPRNGRRGQARRRRRAQLLHPERPPEGLRGRGQGRPGVTIAGIVDGQNIQDNALAAAENLMTGNPDMTAIYATGEPALMGAIAAVESQGKQDQVKIFGWDLTAQAIDGIDDGYVVAVIQQDPAGMGAAGGQGARHHHRRRHRREDAAGAGHHRHQGECRALPRRLQVIDPSDSPNRCRRSRRGRDLPPASGESGVASPAFRCGASQDLRLASGAARGRSRPLPRRVPRPGRRQRRRQVDADQGHLRHLHARRAARSRSTASPSPSRRPPRPGPAPSRWSTRTSRLCDHIDVVGNLFLGRELHPRPRSSTSRRCSPARGRCSTASTSASPASPPGSRSSPAASGRRSPSPAPPPSTPRS